ncbi:TGS domain-containing protein [Candidatus Bathyarchaeota archaeon]|nr:TGS domain-containing protein [Candidatus Bathyarchaeota archaeon]
MKQLVTNLPDVAKAKWNEVTLTKNPEERIRLMSEFLSLVPKHKGTERMCSQVKKQISALREDIEKKKKQKKSSHLTNIIPKAGAAQIVIIGPTNVGRSSVLKAVTNAQVEITDYAFGTKQPIPGMLQYQDIFFQLIEVPPIVKGSSEGRANGYQNLNLIRNADGIIIVIDLSNDPIENFQMIQRELDNSQILINKPKGEIELLKRGDGTEIQFIWEGELSDCSTEDIIVLLREYRVKSALIRIKGKVSLDVVEDAIFSNTIHKPTLLIANKSDLLYNKAILHQLKEVFEPENLIISSAQKNQELKKILGDKIFKLLNIARIYTRNENKVQQDTPIIAKNGITVGELTKIIHNDFYRNFKFARISGPSAKFPNEKVGLDRKLLDRTIIQIYI